MPRPKLRTPALRQRILDAATARLEQEGHAGLTARAVARAAGTSTPAVYELFGSMAGLERAAAFAGFEALGRRVAALPETDDPAADLVAVMGELREFLGRHRVLAELMFGRSVAALAPGPAERAQADAARTAVVARLRRAVDAGVVEGDPADLAHVLLALAQGLAAQEAAGWLGTSDASVDRRWHAAAGVALHGMARPAPARSRSGAPARLH